jgi:hypothetical protein
MYELQVSEGRYFLHEHPNSASSWRYECMHRLIINPLIGSVVSNMCQYGMMQLDDDGIERHVKKPTRWLSNSPFILNELDKRCAGDHHHVQLLGGKAKAAQVYPKRLCSAILKGLKKQLTCDGVISERFIGSVEPEEERVEDVEDWETYCDESGIPLETGMVKEARRDEVDGLKGRGTYVKRTLEECWRVTGRAPIKTRYVDINKGDHASPNYRSRLVVTEIRARNPIEDHFAAMPPLEAKKALFSLAATRGFRSKTGERFKLGFIDVSKAYLYAKVKRDI